MLCINKCFKTYYIVVFATKYSLKTPVVLLLNIKMNNDIFNLRVSFKKMIALTLT
jgi:hypothetical protein